MPSESLEPLIPSLADLVNWFNEEAIPYAVVGGVAASLQGEQRVTADIDAVILTDESKLDEFLQMGRTHGFVPRIPDPIEFARRSRVLLLRHAGEKLGVDLSLGAITFETQMIERAAAHRVLDMTVRLARPEDLIVMKTLAFRPRDISDIESLLDANPKVDIRHVRRWLRLLAEGLEDPDIAERLERLLKTRRAARPRRRPRRPKEE